LIENTPSLIFCLLDGERPTLSEYWGWGLEGKVTLEKEFSQFIFRDNLGQNCDG